MEQYEYVVDRTYARDLAGALVTRLRRQPRLWIVFGVLYIFVALAMASLEDDAVFAAVIGLVVTGGGCAFFLHLLRVQSENNSRAMYQEGTALRSAFLADSFVTENALWTTRWRYEAVDGVEEFGQFVLIRFVSGARNVYKRELFPATDLELLRSRITERPVARPTV